MSVGKRCLVTFGLLTWLGSSAGAQEIVPGGWAYRFSYQSLNGSDLGPEGDASYPGGFRYGGPSSPYGGPSPYGYVPSAPNYPPPPGPFTIHPPRRGTTNATGGLIQVIRRTTRQPGR